MFMLQGFLVIFGEINCSFGMGLEMHYNFLHLKYWLLLSENSCQNIFKNEFYLDNNKNKTVYQCFFDFFWSYTFITSLLLA